MRTTVLLGAVAGFVVVACGDGSLAGPGRRAIPETAAMSELAGTQKTPIAGTLQIFGIAAPDRSMVTPAGMCHAWDLLEFVSISGDLQGTLTFQNDPKYTCDNTHLLASGAFGGAVIFQGRSGDIAGHWETNCKFDSSLGTLSCGGVMNARGSGGLDGVQVHLDWGPGWWPFSYSGTAFSQ